MKSQDVLKQLYATLPALTDKFSGDVGILSVSANGSNVVTVETSAPHALQNGSYVNIRDVFYPTPVESASRLLDKLFITTLEDHDFTLKYQGSAELLGSNEPEFVGEFSVLDVPNRRQIICEIEDSGAVDATGSVVLIEKTGFKKNQLNGFKHITLIDETHFSFVIDAALTFSYSGGVVTTGYRMATAIDLESIIKMYTAEQLDDFWLFVVVGDVVASKDRRNNSDAVYVSNNPAGYRQESVHNLSIYVLATTSTSLSAGSVRDDMEDIAKALMKSVCGFKVDNGTSSRDYYSMVFESHRTAFYNDAIYAHVFNYQSVGQITEQDIFANDNSVAFRDVFLEMMIVPQDIGDV